MHLKYKDMIQYRYGNINLTKHGRRFCRGLNSELVVVQEPPLQSTEWQETAVKLSVCVTSLALFSLTRPFKPNLALLNSFAISISHYTTCYLLTWYCRYNFLLTFLLSGAHPECLFTWIDPTNIIQVLFKGEKVNSPNSIKYGPTVFNIVLLVAEQIP